jgi:hypothetical protein
MSSRLGLLIVSLVVLAIGLMMGAIGYSLNHESVKTYHEMNCANSLFRGAACDDRIAMMGAGIAIIVVGGIFIIVGFIASIIFGVKLVIRKINR